MGLGVLYPYIQAAETIAGRQARIAIVAAFLLASAALLTTDPATNASIGNAVASKISFMRAILTISRGRGGGSQIKQYISILSLKYFTIIVDSIKIPVLEVNFYQVEFTANSKMIINNIFKEHTTRRFTQRSVSKFKTIVPTCLAPIASIKNTTALIGWPFFGVGLIVFTTLSVWCLFQYVEHERFKT